MLSKKAIRIDEIFTVNLTVCSKCQIDGEDFVNFHGLLKKYELYLSAPFLYQILSKMKNDKTFGFTFLYDHCSF